MKKVLAILMSVILVGTMSLVILSAEDEETTATDGYVFEIKAVDGRIVAESGIILTTEEALADSATGWSIVFQCEKVEDNLYKAKYDAFTDVDGNVKELTLANDDIVIAIHSASSDMEQIDEYPNVPGKLQAMAVKAGMYFTLSGIDLTKAGAVEDGTATLSLKDPREPEEEEEVIELDGILDDTGWTEDGWTNVNSENGKWQTPVDDPETEDEETRDENYDFQFRTDDENLYLGFKLNSAPVGTETVFGNGKGANLRIWFKTDADYLGYTSFFNISYNGTDEAVVSFFKNTNAEDNDAEEVEDITGSEVATTVGDDYWYVEAKIPFALFEATTEAQAFVSFSTPISIEEDAPVKNNALTYGKYADPEPDSEESIHTHAPYNDWDEDAEISLVFADLKLGTVSSTGPSLEDQIIELMGEEVEDPAYLLEVTAPEKYTAGETVDVTITLKDVEAAGISIVEFYLYYDADKVEPVVKGDGNLNLEMLDFLVESPDATTWESFSKLEEEEERYFISFGTYNIESEAKEDGDIVITVPFTVKEDTTGKIAFWAPHSESNCSVWDADAKDGKGDYVEVYGNCGYVILSSDTVEDESSKDESSKPGEETGDAGMIALAIVALFALAGATTVAVKKRSR